MSKYIELDKVLSKLCLNHKDVIYIDKNECAKRIEKIPSIDIVRCKECKWLTKDQYDEPYCGFHSIGIYADDFCSYGERREP